jgi:hypothetical protein
MWWGTYRQWHHIISARKITSCDRRERTKPQTNISNRDASFYKSRNREEMGKC